MGVVDYPVRPAREVTDDERIAWIDRASYRELLQKWRFEPSGSPWFSGRVGEHFAEAMRIAKQRTPAGEQVSASKQIGFDR